VISKRVDDVANEEHFFDEVEVINRHSRDPSEGLAMRPLRRPRHLGLVVVAQTGEVRVDVLDDRDPPDVAILEKPRAFRELGKAQ
jgi:hypothetical protein